MKHALLATLLLLPSSLTAQTIEERLSKLEAEVRELREENRALRAQLVATPQPQPVAVQAAGKESKITVGGLIQTQAESGGRIDPRFSDDNDRVFLRRARVNVNGAFAEHFDFRAELDLAGSLGNTSAMRAQATDVYVTWNEHPFAKVRAGQFKTPYGLEQLTSDNVLHTPERTFGTDRLTLGRQLGVMLFGDVANKRLSYSIGGFNGTGTNANFNDDEGFAGVARLSGAVIDTKPLRWSVGVNGLRSDDRNVSVAPELGFANNVFRGEREAIGIDTQLIAGPFELWAERLDARFDPESGADRDATANMIMGVWSITKRIQAVARYDDLESGAFDQRTWTLGTNYFIKGHDLKLQLHWFRSDDDSRVIARLQTIF